MHDGLFNSPKRRLHRIEIQEVITRPSAVTRLFTTTTIYGAQGK